MKKIDALLSDYASHHATKGNVACHFVGIPLIVFGILSMLRGVRIAEGSGLLSTDPRASRGQPRFPTAFSKILPGMLLLDVFSALAAGRPSLNAYFQSNLTDTAYQKKTFDRVAKAWKTPAASQIPEVGKKTVVQAVIGRDGALTSTVISMKSGKKGWDDASLRAVKTASPFDPLPAGFKPPSVEVHFHVSVVP